MSIGGSGLSVPSPANNCKGGINSGCLLHNSQSSPDTVNEDGNNSSTSGIHRLKKNNDKTLINEAAEDAYVGSPREIRQINIGNNKGDNGDDTNILLRIHGANLSVGVYGVILLLVLCYQNLYLVWGEYWVSIGRVLEEYRYWGNSTPNLYILTIEAKQEKYLFFINVNRISPCSSLEQIRVLQMTNR